MMPPDTILAGFGLAGATVAPLGGGLSGAVWQVDTATRRYVLRQYGDLDNRPSHVVSELVWLDALATRSGGRTPVPIRLPDGQLAPIRDIGPDGERPVAWALIGWVDGVTLGQLPDPGEVALIGDLLATMHRVAQDWSRPPGFSRPSYVGAYFGEMTRSLLGWSDAQIGEADRQRLVEAMRAATAILDDLLSDPREVGLIHADVHDGNVVFGGEPRRAGLIDFARFGDGCWALDLAMAMHYLTDELAEDLATAYMAAFDLSLQARQSLPHLRLLAGIENLAILARFPEEAAFVTADLPALVQRARELTS